MICMLYGLADATVLCHPLPSYPYAHERREHVLPPSTA